VVNLAELVERERTYRGRSLIRKERRSQQRAKYPPEAEKAQIFKARSSYFEVV